MLVITVKESQAEYRNTGMLFQGTWYVDDSIVDGLEKGTFCGIASGKSKCLNEKGGQEQATLVPAGKDVKVKASGIVYESSAPDRYGRKDNMEDETRLYPYGRRQSLAIGLLKEGVLQVSSTLDPKYRHFRTVDEVVGTTTGAVAGGVITLNADAKVEVRYGDKIKVGDEVGHVVEVTSKTSIKAVGLTDSATGEVKVLCQIDDPVYLNKKVTIKPEDHGKYEKIEGLPFTTVPPQDGELGQYVGYVESPISVRVDLKNHIDPIVV